jgi:glutathione S-transferase
VKLHIFNKVTKMTRTLISATPSAYARINRIALMEKGIPFELKNEVPWNKDTETPTYNPLEKLPILIFEDGSAMYDSLLIQEWIIRKYADKGPPLLPKGEDAGFAARQIQTLSNGHMDAMVLAFLEKNRNHPSPE